MLEILYRIYRKKTQEEVSAILDGEKTDYFPWGKLDREEVAMDCFMCETREDFKDYIKSCYGTDIKFRYDKKIKENEYYCIIIGEHAYNVEKYFNTVEYDCAYCKTKVKGSIASQNKIPNYDIRARLGNNLEYAKLNFCSGKCMHNFIVEERSKLFADEADIDGLWISRDDFTNSELAGYIYKISKKKTGEFYIGQTIYVPIFRWGQHLRTSRFPIKDITDYVFEVIELVPKGGNLLEREKYWIQKCYLENPTLSLNIAGVSNLKSKELQE